MFMRPPPLSPPLSCFFSCQVESSEAPKDTASAPKCPPPAHDTSPMEQVPNGDAEMGSPENSSTADLKGRQRGESEASSLPDGEAGQILENGRCTPKASPDLRASEGELGGERERRCSLPEGVRAGQGGTGGEGAEARPKGCTRLKTTTGRTGCLGSSFVPAAPSPMWPFLLGRAEKNAAQ